MTLVNLQSFDRSLMTLRKPFALIGVMIVAMGLDVLVQSLAHFSSPGLFLLPAIAVIGMAGGIHSALVAAGASVIFVAVAYSTHGSIFTLRFDAVIRLCLFSVSAPIIAVVVGIQRKLIDDASNGRVEEALRARADELAEVAQALQKSNDELDQFAYVTSHDLKAPLRGINNLSKWIEEDLGDRVTPQAKEQLDLLRGRVQRMESLINGLLEYSHVGRTQGKTERVDVGPLLADVIDWIGPPANIKIEIAPGMPVFITDKLRLQQVFTNLIENAIKHHGPTSNGQIAVASSEVDLFYRFSVTDDGQGIDPRYHERIFGIFQTLLPRDRMDGAGIGLSLVKKIVSSKGGEISVESAPGQGATFQFTWPKAEAQP